MNMSTTPMSPAVGAAFPQEWAYLMGGLGAALSVGLSAVGGAIGTAKTGQGLQALRDGANFFLALIPVVMSGVVSIYGLILAVIIQGKMGKSSYTTLDGAFDLGAGLACGLPCLAAGWSIGCIAKSWYETMGKGEKLSMGRMVLVLIYAEALGLYGLIVGLIVSGNHH